MDDITGPSPYKRARIQNSEQELAPFILTHTKSNIEIVDLLDSPDKNLGMQHENNGIQLKDEPHAEKPLFTIDFETPSSKVFDIADGLDTSTGSTVDEKTHSDMGDRAECQTPNTPKLQQETFNNQLKQALENESSVTGGVVDCQPSTPTNSPVIYNDAISNSLSPSFTQVSVASSGQIILGSTYTLPTNAVESPKNTNCKGPSEGCLPSVQTLFQNRSNTVVKEPEMPQLIHTGLNYSELKTMPNEPSTQVLSSSPVVSTCDSLDDDGDDDDDDWTSQPSPASSSEELSAYHTASLQLPVITDAQPTSSSVYVLPQNYTHQQMVAPIGGQIWTPTPPSMPLITSTPRMVTTQTTMPCASQNINAYQQEFHKQIGPYDRTPHPVLTGRTVTPSNQISNSALQNMQRLVCEKLQTPVNNLQTINQHQAHQLLQSGHSFRTPASHLSQLTLNSSGSEEERSPPDVNSSFIQTRVPYNTPVGFPVRNPSHLPTAADLQAALFRSHEAMDSPDTVVGREQHNAKERARRARIKNACDNLRDMMPGNMARTDKATLMELAVEYIKHLRGLTGETFDKEFVKKTTPFLNMDLE